MREKIERKYNPLLDSNIFREIEVRKLESDYAEYDKKHVEILNKKNYQYDKLFTLYSEQNKQIESLKCCGNCDNHDNSGYFTRCSINKHITIQSSRGMRCVCKEWKQFVHGE